MKKLYISRKTPTFLVRAIAVLAVLVVLFQLPLADLPWAGHPALLVLGLVVTLGSFGQASKLAAETASWATVCSPLAHVFLLSASVLGCSMPAIVLLSFGPQALEPAMLGLPCTAASLVAGCLALDSWALHHERMSAPRRQARNQALKEARATLA